MKQRDKLGSCCSNSAGDNVALDQDGNNEFSKFSPMLYVFQKLRHQTCWWIKWEKEVEIVMTAG